jgi:hypothetical protein
MLSLFCQTDQPLIAPCRRSLRRSSMASIRSSLRSRWTSYRPSCSSLGVQRLTECLLAYQGPVRQFLFPGLEPRQYLAFEEAAQALGVCDGGRLALVQFGGVAGQRVLSVKVRLGYRRRDRKSRLSRINDAKRLRSSIASVVKLPTIFPVALPFRRSTASRAAMHRQRVLPATAGDWHGFPRLVSASQRLLARSGSASP